MTSMVARNLAIFFLIFGPLKTHAAKLLRSVSSATALSIQGTFRFGLREKWVSSPKTVLRQVLFLCAVRPF